MTKESTPSVDDRTATDRDADSADGEHRCTLCSLPAERVEVTDADDNRFCCRGCRDVYDALGDVDDISASDVRQRVDRPPAGGGEADVAPADDATSGADSEDTTRDDATPNEAIPGDATPDDAVPDDHETTFLEVRGMYCATCEAFIESLAAATDGVSAVSASYATETVRVDHDPEEVSAAELCDAVSGLGYEAFLREDGISRRQADNREAIRLGVGVLVGMMVMMQYVTIIYPTYFGGLVYDEATAQFLADSMAHTSGYYFFFVIAFLTTIVLVVAGKPILQGAYVAIRTRSPNMDLLVAIAALSAYVYSTLAILVQEQPDLYYDVTVAIVVVVTVGSYYESTLKRRATERLSELTAVQVDDARRVDGDGRHEVVDVDALEAGDRILVRTGERVPVDGEVLEGEAAVDESVVTGESLPVSKQPSDRVVGGSVVADGALTVRVGEDATSSLDRISELVWDLQSADHGVQGLAHRLATIFVPVVLALAVVATVVNLGLGAGVAAALLVGLTVLIVSCPCPLGLATPLAVASGLRDALEHQIVVFDDTVFERVRQAETVVFDKTGTLTTGEMEVLEADVDGELLRDAAALERRSAHPVGEAIAALVDESVAPADDDRSVASDGGGRAADESGRAADGSGEATDRSDVATAANQHTASADATPNPTDHAPDAVESFESHDRGVSGVVGGREVVVGHPDLFRERGWTVPEELATTASEARDVGRVPVLIGRDGRAAGVVVVGDELRAEWADTFDALADRDVDIVVLTGDDERAATVFREHDAVSQVFAGVPPEGKAETVARLSARGETVVVGDGTNDAPALARADLGIALGGGTAMAADAADVAIVDDDLRSVETMFDLSGAAGSRVKQNVGWAFCYNAIALPLAVTGLLNPLFAALAMGTSSLLVVGNSSRRLLDDPSE